MSEIKVGSQVIVTNQRSQFSRYEKLAAKVGLKNWVEGASLTDGDTGTVTQIVPHPGFLDEGERLACMLILGEETHPEEGQPIAVVERKGQSYLIKTDGEGRRVTFDKPRQCGAFSYL